VNILVRHVHGSWTTAFVQEVLRRSGLDRFLADQDAVPAETTDRLPTARSLVAAATTGRS